MPPRTRAKGARSAARTRLARASAARVESARHRRRRALIGASAAVAVIVVLGAVVWLVAGRSGGHPTATPSAAPTEGPCDWSVVPPAARAKEMRDVGTPPATGEPRTGTATMTITTNRGVIKIAIDRARTPCAAASFAYLAGKGFFDNTTCHRLVPEPLRALHCGDPAADGWGGPTYRYLDEDKPAGRRPAYPKGTVALANGGENTNQSQFYVFYEDSPVDAGAPILGHVTEGIELVQEVAKAGHDGAFDKNEDGSPGPGGGHPKLPVTIQTVTVT